MLRGIDEGRVSEFCYVITSILVVCERDMG